MNAPPPSSPAHSLRWIDGDAASLRCPVCADAAAKRRVLSIEIGGEPHELVACGDCGLLFFPGLAPASYAAWDAGAGARGFELRFGLIGSIECLAKLDLDGVRRFLEIGCGTAYTSDFGRTLHGWEVLGLDESAWAQAAGRELGVPVTHALLGEEAVGGDWDLALASEVIEHVADPVAFAAAARGSLAAAGVLLLRTPAAESLAPDLGAARVAELVSPGFHTMLHSRESLERTLRAAGFAHVAVVRDGFSLHAAASQAPLRWDPAGQLDRGELGRYLERRIAELPPNSAARLGLAQQLADERVADRDATGVELALAALDGSLRARYGAGLDADAAALPRGAEVLWCHALGTVAAAAELQGQRERAIAAWSGAARAGELALAGREALEAVDLAHLYATRHAQLQRTIHAGSPADAAALLEEAGEERPRLLAQLLSGAVGAGRLELVEPFAEEALRALADADADAAPDAPAAAAERAAALWALGLVLLVSRGDAAASAPLFERAAAVESLDRSLRMSAVFHAGYALVQLGEHERARPHLALVGGAPAGDPAVPDELRTRARALLNGSAPAAAEPAPEPEPLSRRRRVTRWLRRV